MPLSLPIVARDLASLTLERPFVLLSMTIRHQLASASSGQKEENFCEVMINRCNMLNVQTVETCEAVP